MATIPPALLEILACPVPDCHGPLTQVADRLVCGRCGRRYPVLEHFPVLIPEEAEPAQSGPGETPSPAAPSP